MDKLKIKAEILSPICIWNGKERDGLNFFIDEDKETFCLVDQNWIERAIQENKTNSNQLLNAIKEGDFQELAAIKNDLGKDFFDIVAEYPLGKSALKILGQQGNSSNQGIVKQQFSNILNNKIQIPGSTIKGIIRTAYLYSLVPGEIKLEGIRFNTYNDRINKREPVIVGNASKIKEIQEWDNMNGTLNDNFFKRIACSDSKVNNEEIKIQIFQSKNKPLKDGSPKKGISLVVESVTKGDIDFDIVQSPNNKEINLLQIEQFIKSYSKLLIDREERLANSVNFGNEFIGKLRDNRGKGKYPIKLGMYKKSLTYKLWWEDLADALNIQKKGRDRKDWAMALGVGDKTIYVDEEENPVGWILLSFS